MSRTYWYIAVDDEMSSHAALEFMMKQYSNYHCKKTFRTPELAIDYLKNNQCDLMFLDIEMPDIDGFKLLKSVQNPPPTIFITGHPGEYGEKAHEYYDMGIIDFVSKSLDNTRFRKSLDRFEKLSTDKMRLEAIMRKKHSYDGLQIKELNTGENLYSSEITYLTIQKNDLYLNTAAGETHRIRIPLHLFIKTYFSESDYVQVSRKVVVLLNHIVQYNSFTISMGKGKNGNDIIIPIANRRRREIEEKLSIHFEFDEM